MHFHNSPLKFIDKKFLLKARPYFRLPLLQEDLFPTTSYTYTGDKNGVIVAISCLPWTWKCGKQEGWNKRWLLYGYQKFYLLPEKLGCLADKRANLAKNWLFWPNIGIFGPFGPMPDHKQCKQDALVVSYYDGTKTFASFRKNQDFWFCLGPI